MIHDHTPYTSNKRDASFFFHLHGLITDNKSHNLPCLLTYKRSFVLSAVIGAVCGLFKAVLRFFNSARLPLISKWIDSSECFIAVTFEDLWEQGLYLSCSLLTLGCVVCHPGRLSWMCVPVVLSFRLLESWGGGIRVSLESSVSFDIHPYKIHTDYTSWLYYKPTDAIGNVSLLNERKASLEVYDSEWHFMEWWKGITPC